MTLQEMGERRIVAEILPRYVSSPGNDAATLDVGGNTLAVTTDPVPQPAAKVIGGDADPYWMGWLLVITNASDLAAAGATPVAFVAALEAHPDCRLSEFERLLGGIAEACSQEGLKYAGGNLREGSELTGVGTAIGFCSKRVVTRVGIANGDAICSVGHGGNFWRDALLLRSGEPLADREISPLFRPHSQIRAMRDLAEAELVSAAMDNSDGLLPSLTQLAVANEGCIHLELDRLREPPGKAQSSQDPARLWLGWGDWNVIVAIRPENIAEASRVVGQAGSHLIQIGYFESGDHPCCYAETGGR